MKKWDRSELHMLALNACTICGGSGIRREKEDELIACRCALRGVFRSCYERFRRSAGAARHLSRVSFERAPRGRVHRGSWGRKEEEFIADFERVARRTLDEKHYKLFRFHFVLGGDWPLYRRRKGGDRGAYFHALYRIEEQLGWAFASLEPYALFPVREYFTSRRREAVSPSSVQLLRRPPNRAHIASFPSAAPVKISA